MGNCQAVDAAALVIQHPNGKIERWYWPISATEVMRMNPGHYVSLIIPLLTSPPSSTDEKLTHPPTSQEKKTVRYTRVKLLRSTDTLVLGRAYRLVTSQEVMKVVQAKKQAKMKKAEKESSKKSSSHHVSHSSSGRRQQEERKLEQDPNYQGVKIEREQRKMTQQSTTNSAVVGRSKSWRPSLQSISEGGS